MRIACNVFTCGTTFVVAACVARAEGVTTMADVSPEELLLMREDVANAVLHTCRAAQVENDVACARAAVGAISTMHESAAPLVGDMSSSSLPVPTEEGGSPRVFPTTACGIWNLMTSTLMFGFITRNQQNADEAVLRIEVPSLTQRVTGAMICRFALFALRVGLEPSPADGADPGQQEQQQPQ